MLLWRQREVRRLSVCCVKDARMHTWPASTNGRARLTMCVCVCSGTRDVCMCVSVCVRVWCVCTSVVVLMCEARSACSRSVRMCVGARRRRCRMRVILRARAAVKRDRSTACVVFYMLGLRSGERSATGRGARTRRLGGVCVRGRGTRWASERAVHLPVKQKTGAELWNVTLMMDADALRRRAPITGRK